MMDETCRTEISLQETVAPMIGALLARREALLAVLTEVATYESAADEVQRAIRALAGAPWEVSRNAPRQLSQVTAFLPSNNILYSYTLFCLIPSLYTDRVIGRSSSRVRTVTQRIHAILGDLTGDRVTLTDATQREFVALSGGSDAVIFTGQADNAQQVMAAVGDGPVVLAFGSGPNPFVIGPEADLDRAAADLFGARLYNSGQDCLCPDVAFVHASLADELVDRLCDAAGRLTVGDRRDPSTRVAPIVYDDAVEYARDFLAAHREYVRHGGRVDAATGVVEPTVVHLPWRDGFEAPEFFAPILCVVTYHDAHDLAAWFTSPTQIRHGMYASVYGEPDLPRDLIGTTVIAAQRTPFDIEDGNRPFGGYGPHAGAVRVDGVVTGRPLLLSDAMSCALVAAAGTAR
jgi:hypothetical protein